MTPLEDYQVKEIAETLRLVSNMIDAPKRDTCLKRMVMKCWHWCLDALKDVPKETTADNGIDYYMKKGLTPYGHECRPPAHNPNADDDGGFFSL